MNWLSSSRLPPSHAACHQCVDDGACPSRADHLTARLVAEVTRLAPWSAETRAARGRTLFGVTGAAPDQVEAVARALGAIAETGNLSEALALADGHPYLSEGAGNYSIEVFELTPVPFEN